MINKKQHNYIEYILRLLDKKYNRNIVLYYNPKCKRTNVSYNKEENKHLLEYGDVLINNALSDKKHWKDHIRYTIFHEMGHIYHKIFEYETFKDKAICEYKAERFALNRLKIMYPKTYKWACSEGNRMVKDKTWPKEKSEMQYRVAWENIREYVR